MVGGTDAQNLLPPALAGYGRSVACGKGERIFAKHGGEDTMALVQEGLVYLCADIERYARGILAFFRPGDWMDTSMLLPLRHGVCYFTTKYAGRLTVFSRKDLLRAAAVQPQAMDIWNGALDGLAQAWLRHSYMLQQRTPRQRLLAFFRWEAERQGGEKDIRLPLPQTDLADYLGVDRAAMARELTRMKQEGLLSGARRTWTLLET